MFKAMRRDRISGFLRKEKHSKSGLFYVLKEKFRRPIIMD